MNIHKTAIIETGAVISPNVQIGPYSFIGANVVIRDCVKIHSHVCISGNTEIGQNTEIFPFAAIGYEPQDLKYKGESSRVIIGKNNKIREYSTINSGTAAGNLKTVIGDNCLLMISSHVAHDCILGNNIIIANNGTLGGHVTLEDNVIIGGLSAVHQKVRIGRFAMIGGMSGVESDVPPFSSALGNRARIVGINIIGMKRGNFSSDSIIQVQKIFKDLFFNNQNTFSEKLEIVRDEQSNSREVIEIVNFLLAESKRGICGAKIDEIN